MLLIFFIFDIFFYGSFKNAAKSQFSVINEGRKSQISGGVCMYQLPWTPPPPRPRTLFQSCPDLEKRRGREVLRELTLRNYIQISDAGASRRVDVLVPNLDAVDISSWVLLG